MRALPVALCGVLVGFGVGFWAAPQVLAGLAAGLAFCLLGRVDDLVEDPGGSRGFRGHLRALAAGRLPGGGIKLLGGALAGLLAASMATPPDRPAWAVL